MSRNTDDSPIDTGLRAPRRRAIALALLLAPALLLICTGEARAQMCAIPPEQGVWTNHDVHTRDITQLEFRMECRKVVDPRCTSAACRRTAAVEPHYFLHLYAACTPTECDWGEVEGERIEGGTLDGWNRFFFDQSHARRYVWVRTHPAMGGWLRLLMYTDFVDPNRTDFRTEAWFRR